ncbi:RNA binding domain containing protein 4 [Sarcoptes scabiei]|nr:RNA binding domain containing protein 4 [Sarcoptes scabiei]
MLSAQSNSSTNFNSGVVMNYPTISACLNRPQLQFLQVAISSNLINPQILNHPMSPHNSEILNELFQQLKLMTNTVHSRGDMMAQTKLKQSIRNLQAQIQGNYQTPHSQFMMQTNRGPVTSGASSISNPSNNMDFFKHNPTSGNGNGSVSNDLSSFDYVQQQQQQQHAQGSRLHSWKNNYNKMEERPTNNDFVRAPGPLSKNNSNSNAWSNFVQNSDEQNWNTDKNDLTGSSLLDDYDFSERFDYNKAWKLSGAKVLDEDPRSPLLNLSLSKDAFPWNNNKSNILGSNPDAFGAFSSNSNSNPWSYAPMPAQTSGSSNVFDLSQSTNKSGPKKSWNNSLNSTNTDYNSDSLWSNAGQENTNNTGSGNNSGTITKPRPPPGLSGKIGNQNNNQNVWNSSTLSSSEYLRLRNLTPQIDGSTLKTLCLQHGPLNQFHLSLNHGVAIVRYANRDQAIKAQSALNNCVLGNTRIIADLPMNNEIQQYLMSNVASGMNTVTTLSQQKQQQSNNSLNSLASSWSNVTNASHSNTVAVAGNNNNVGNGGSNIQSYQNQQQSTARVSGTHQMMVSSNAAPIVSSNNNLPYPGASASGLSTHSSSLPFGSGCNNTNQFSNNGSGSNSKLETSGGWSSGSIMWDLSGNSNNPSVNTTGSGSASNPSANSLWSASGFSANDRNTPIQNFLPNDLLAGENN